MPPLPMRLPETTPPEDESIESAPLTLTPRIESEAARLRLRLLGVASTVIWPLIAPQGAYGAVYSHEALISPSAASSVLRLNVDTICCLIVSAFSQLVILRRSEET